MPPLSEDAARKQITERDSKIKSMTQKMFTGEAMDMSALMNGFQDNSPSFKASIKLLANIGPSLLASLGEGRRVVLSTDPTQVQVSFPKKSDDIIRQFIQEQRIVDRITKETQGQGAMMGTMAIDISAAGQFGGRADGNPASPGTTTLVLSRVGFADSISATLTSYDTSGKLIATGGASILLTGTKQPPALTGKTPVSLTPLAAEYVFQGASSQPSDMMGRVGAVFGGAGKNAITIRAEASDKQGAPSVAKPKAVSKDLSTALQNMDKQDPWAIIAPGILDPLAAQKNVIALIPDVLFEKAIRTLGAPQATCEAVINTLRTEGTLKVKNEDAWLTITPSSPVTYRESFVDRTALGTLMRSTYSKGYANLEDIARFAVAQERMVGASTFGQFHLQIVQKMSGIMTRNYLSVNEFDGTRLYGLLSPNQRQMMLNGGKLAIRTLDASQLDALYRVTYDSIFGPMVSKPGQRPQNIPGMEAFGAAFQMGDLAGGGLEKERTVFLPTGLVPDGTISLKASPTQDTWLGKEKSSGKIAFGGPELVGMASIAEKLPANLKSLMSTAKYDSFMRAKSVSYTLTVDFTPMIYLSRSYQDYLVDTTREYAYNDMPDDFKKQASDMVNQLKNVDFGAIFGGGAGTGRINP